MTTSALLAASMASGFGLKSFLDQTSSATGLPLSFGE
jgi:hypothetical protein